MEKGICAITNCNKKSEYVLTYRYVAEIGGKLQENETAPECYCNDHAVTVLKEKQQYNNKSTPHLTKIDDINNNNNAPVRKE